MKYLRQLRGFGVYKWDLCELVQDSCKMEIRLILFKEIVVRNSAFRDSAGLSLRGPRPVASRDQGVLEITDAGSSLCVGGNPCIIQARYA